MNRTEDGLERILIVGSGFMGRGIAQICAQSGFSVTLLDRDERALAEAQKEMQWSMEKLFSKGKVSHRPEKVLSMIHLSTDAMARFDVNFLFECVPEDLSVKTEVLRHYDRTCPGKTIFASNTSAIPIGKLAVLTDRADRFIGTHFASPPVIQRLVELIPALMTSAETVQSTRSLLEALDREVVEVRADTAGFIMNRIYLIAAAEAIRLLERGAGSAEDIDRAMRVGYGWAKGPLEAADFAGLDVIHGAMLSIWMDTGDPMFRPPERLCRLVEAGRLGRKTGEGLYDYKS